MSTCDRRRPDRPPTPRGAVQSRTSVLRRVDDPARGRHSARLGRIQPTRLLHLFRIPSGDLPRVAARVYYVFTGRRWALCLLPLVFAGCNFHFNTSLEFPNHTAWRPVAFHVATWIFVLLRPTNPAVCVGLAMRIVAGRINAVPDRAAITAGYFKSPTSLRRPTRTTAVPGIIFHARHGVGLGCGCGITRVVALLPSSIGLSLILAAVPEQLYMARMYSSTGFAQHQATRFSSTRPALPSPCGLELSPTGSTLPGASDGSWHLRASVAATILVWFAYYFNPPQ